MKGGVQACPTCSFLPSTMANLNFASAASFSVFKRTFSCNKNHKLAVYSKGCKIHCVRRVSSQKAASVSLLQGQTHSARIDQQISERKTRVDCIETVRISVGSSMLCLCATVHTPS